MAQYTYYENGDMAIRSSNTDDMLQEFVKQSEAGFKYRPETYTPVSIYTNNCRIHVTKDFIQPTADSVTYDFFEYDTFAKLVARDVTSFFYVLSQKLTAGYTYKVGTVWMAPGAYSCELEPVSKPVTTSEPEVVPKVEEFSLDVALSISSKEGLLEYAERFNIQLDKRSNLSKLRNQLKTKVS